MADPVELKLLHMITDDPLRTPTYVMFGDPDYFFQTFGPDVVVNPGFAWNLRRVSRKRGELSLKEVERLSQQFRVAHQVLSHRTHQHTCFAARQR